MNITLSLLFFAIPLILILLAGTIALQIFLSLRTKAWPGLILPGINGVLIIALVLRGIILQMGMLPIGFATRILWLVGLLSFFGLLINLLIYWLCRRSRRLGRQQELKKMSIQDLN